MLPVGLLMKEHRLIERLMGLVAQETEDLERGRPLDAGFVFKAVEFIQVYADETHHGKEEDILFRELDEKELTPEHRRTMEELIEEHVYGRRTVGTLVSATERHLRGDEHALREAAVAMRELALFYPTHIEKEDEHFFLPVMDYFSDGEKDAMLEEMQEFDRQMIHEHYGSVVSDLTAEKEDT